MHVQCVKRWKHEGCPLTGCTASRAARVRVPGKRTFLVVSRWRMNCAPSSPTCLLSSCSRSCLLLDAHTCEPFVGDQATRPGQERSGTHVCECMHMRAHPATPPPPEDTHLELLLVGGIGLVGLVCQRFSRPILQALALLPLVHGGGTAQEAAAFGLCVPVCAAWRDGLHVARSPPSHSPRPSAVFHVLVLILRTLLAAGRLRCFHCPARPAVAIVGTVGGLPVHEQPSTGTCSGAGKPVVQQPSPQRAVVRPLAACGGTLGRLGRLAAKARKLGSAPTNVMEYNRA